MEVYHKVPHYASLQPAACFSALQLCLQRKPVLKKGTAAGDRQPRKGGCSEGMSKGGFSGGPAAHWSGGKSLFYIFTARRRIIYWGVAFAYAVFYIASCVPR